MHFFVLRFVSVSHCCSAHVRVFLIVSASIYMGLRALVCLCVLVCLFIFVYVPLCLCLCWRAFVDVFLL